MDRFEDQPGDGDSSEAGEEPTATAEGKCGDSETTDEDGSQVKTEATWEFKERLPIQDRMVEVISLTRKVAEQELNLLRRKLRKMQLGS